MANVKQDCDVVIEDGEGWRCLVLPRCRCSGFCMNGAFKNIFYSNKDHTRRYIEKPNMIIENCCGPCCASRSAWYVYLLGN